jgi:hypothetical protein
VRQISIFILVLFIATGALFASPINPLNDRDPQIAVPSSPLPNGQPDLQSVLNGMFGVNAVQAVGDQEIAGMWGLSAMPPSSIPTIAAEYQSGVNQVFGIWFGSDTSNIHMYDIFLNAATTGEAAGIQFSGAGYNTLTVFGGSNVNSFTATAPWINPLNFGFYVHANTPSGAFDRILYTVDSLNTNPSGGIAAAVAYNKPGTDTWAIAFETDFGASTTDYQDFVVKVESIEAVPEPGTMILLGSGILALGLFRRFKK